MATQSNHCSYCERGTSALCKVSVVGAYYDIASDQVEWLADRIARGYPRIDANATTWPDAWAANN